MSSPVSRKIELLSPARNAETGRAAVDHGADAVYIGAPRFGARSAAGCTLSEIESLVRYAHRYGASVYIALNTILKDDELSEAVKMIHTFYRMGADAVIIQDVGLLKADLPPIALHASTQMDNRTVEKVRFLEAAGFSQVVLARELSLRQIQEIADAVRVPLEVFVHGALCVSYSGQCYLSQALCGRSANRGECAQYCRMPYTLIDAAGKTLVSEKHLLSLRDLNQSAGLEALLDAGVTSLKIEGRLKETSYVKNITAYYRQQLDRLFERRPEYRPASAGRTRLLFTPVPEKSFNRGFTDYYLYGRKNEPVISPDTPKSLGEPVGKVKEAKGRFIRVSGGPTLHNGDGLCFPNVRGEFEGFRINRSEDDRIFPAAMPEKILPGTPLYRNYDREFEKKLSQTSAVRTIRVDMMLYETPFGIALQCEDESGNRVILTEELPKETARTPQQENIIRQLSRTGGTGFEVGSVHIGFSGERFIPVSCLAELRRRALGRLTMAGEINRRPPLRSRKFAGRNLPDRSLSYLGNVANKAAEEFYKECGITAISPAFEVKNPGPVPLMFTRHCLKHWLGSCPKSGKAVVAFEEPLFLVSRNNRLRLEFDCGRCEMRIYKA